MKKKNILISGGSSGIGFSIANDLIKQGHNVGIISRHESSKWVNRITNSWNNSENHIQCDLIKGNFVQIDNWLKKQKNLNALILCANYYGAGSRKDLLDTSKEDWINIFKVNVQSQFLLIKKCVPLLESSKNSIILSITSDVAFTPGEGRIAYASSKVASHKMMSSLSIELKAKNISVVELLPTNTVKTPGIEKRRPEGFSYKEYHSSGIFIKPASNLINLPNKKFSGKYIKVYNNRVIIKDSISDCECYGKRKKMERNE